MYTIEEIKQRLWNDVRFVLLDMDGTLLDKYFDDYFWEHLVPEKYAEKNNISVQEAKEELLRKYRSHEGTLNWTDIDFWSRELDLDIPALKEQIRHLIEVHPYVIDFLEELKKHKKRVFLLTNAHYKTLTIKLRKTEIGHFFDRVVTSFDMKAPKEKLDFWHRAQKVLDFDKHYSLFIDDTVDILYTARDFGIKYIIHKAKANSKDETKNTRVNSFPSIAEFRELLP